MINEMINRNLLKQLCSRLISLAIICMAVGSILLGYAESSMAYSIDYGMDKARAEKTIEYYGEGVRPYVEDTLRNNEDHPDSKDTASNSYRRESIFNRLLPKKRGAAFSDDTLMNLRKTGNPKDVLKK